MTKKQILTVITGLAVGAVIAAVLVLRSGDSVRETSSDPDSNSSRDQTFVQAPRPKPEALPQARSGPDSPESPVTKTSSSPQVPVESEPEGAAMAPDNPDSASATTADEAVYYQAMVFRDEALSTFPVHTVQVFQPDSVKEDLQTGRIGGKYFGPKANEVWLRIKPESAGQMREIMAQTADLYREYLGQTSENIVVVNWVGGQAWARMEFGPDGSPVTP